LLLEEERLLDILGLHTRLSHVVAHCLRFLEEFDTESAGQNYCIEKDNLLI
jgi:hypothetical protein